MSNQTSRRTALHQIMGGFYYWISRSHCHTQQAPQSRRLLPRRCNPGWGLSWNLSWGPQAGGTGGVRGDIYSGTAHSNDRPRGIAQRCLAADTACPYCYT